MSRLLVLLLAAALAAAERVDRLARLVSRNGSVKLEVDIGTQLRENVDSFSVLAEIPGGARRPIC